MCVFWRGGEEGGRGRYLSLVVLESILNVETREHRYGTTYMACVKRAQMNCDRLIVEEYEVWCCFTQT